jgi:hypothetical protein
VPHEESKTSYALRLLATALSDVVLCDIEGDYEGRHALIVTAMHYAQLSGYAVGFTLDSKPENEGFEIVATIVLPTGPVTWHMPTGNPALVWDGADKAATLARIESFCRVTLGAL